MSHKSNDNNSEDLNSLPNETIRKRLEEEFGFNCGPITASTRSVYLKKLIKLIDEKHERDQHLSQTNHNNNSSVGNDFDTNGDELYTNSSKSSSMRLSSLRTPSQRSSPRRKLDEEFGSTSLQSKTSTPKTKRQTIHTITSNKKITESAKSGRKSLALTSGPRIVSSDTNSHSSTLTTYSSDSSENDDMIDEEMMSKIRKSPRKKASTPPSRALQDQLSSSQRVPFARPYPPPPLIPMTNASKLSATFSPLARPPLRSGFTPMGPPVAKLANYSDSEDTEQEQNENIRKRLLSHRPGLNITTITTSKPSQSSSAAGYEDSNNFSSTSNFISFAILVLVVLFFVFIFSFYFYTRISSSPKSAVDLTNFHFIDEELVAPICLTDSNNELFSGDSDNCLKYKSDIMPALTIVKEIKTFIDKALLKYYCGPNDKKSSLIDPKHFETKDLKNAIKSSIDIIKSNREGINIEEDLNVVYDRDFGNALILVELNPNWQLKTIRDSLKEISKIRISDDYPLNLPFGCHSLLVLKQNSWKIFTAFIAIFIAFASILYFKHSKRVKTEEQDLVYDLVEKSLELLQSPDNPQSMPVLHIRDTLLSAAERKTSKYKRIWAKVVKHIESTESRVKIEIENIEGDDYKTWKWMATHVGNSEAQGSNSSTIIRTGNIEWQGQAFAVDNNVSQSANNGGPAPKMPFSAPTIFLKIRNMFDKETKLSDPQNWKINRRNAILEKTAIASKTGKHGIVHIEIEEDSHEGLVYLKCDSIESATNAFNALHGWWCEKKLVSVKFLKEERYHQRFPESAGLPSKLTT